MDIDPICLDEAYEVINKFVRQTIKDYITPSLRFSRLKSERECWETAKDFLYGKTCIEWGDLYLSIYDMCLILGVEWEYIFKHVIATKVDNMLKYIKKENKKRDGIVTIAYINCVANKGVLQTKLRKIGIIPAFAFPLDSTEIYEDIDVDEVQNYNYESLRFDTRKIVDRNIISINKSSIMVILWSAGINDFQVLSEVSLAYQAHIPIYLYISPTGPPIPKILLTYCRTPCYNLEDLFISLKEIVGSGRGKILTSLVRTRK